MKKLMLIGLLLIAAFSGCTGAGDKSSGAYRAPEVQYMQAASEDSSGGFDQALSKAAETTEVSSTSIDRKIIKTAHLSLEVANFDSAAESVEMLAQASGGFVSNSNSYITGTDHKRGTITIRVPEEGFIDVLGEVKKLGKVKSTSSSGQDVTEEYVDLDARLRNLERQEGRLLEILENANTVDDLLKVEGQLGRVRGEIERITGRLRYLDNVVALATITVELAEPEPITRAWGLRESLSSSIEGFINSTNAIIVLIGFLAPVAIFLTLLFGVYRLVRRTLKKKPGV